MDIMKKLISDDILTFLSALGAEKILVVAFLRN